MASVSLLAATLLLFVATFVTVELAPLQNFHALLRLRREVPRSNANVFGTPMTMNMNSKQEGQEIRDSINIKKPVVNVNRNTGAVSSSSVSNAALINQPKTLGQGDASLKLGQGLAIGISIQGPLGAATNDTFANTQMFNTDSGDFGNSFANAGNISPGVNAAQTGTNIQLQSKNPSGFQSANTFNNAKVNMFNAQGSHNGQGGSKGSAGAFSNING